MAALVIMSMVSRLPHLYSSHGITIENLTFRPFFASKRNSLVTSIRALKRKIKVWTGGEGNDYYKVSNLFKIDSLVVLLCDF